MGILFWSVILVVSIFFLVKSADYFTEFSEKLGLLLGISPFIVGVTIISLGTSLPELITGLVALYTDVGRDATIFVADNIVGSNISNILLVIGISSIIAGMITIKKNILADDFPILLASALFAIITISDGHFSRMEAFIALTGYVVYMWYNISSNQQSQHDKDVAKQMRKDSLKNWQWIYPTIIVLSCIGLYFSADWTVRSVFEIANILAWPPSVITIIAVALGTSLPELVVSAKAAFNKNFEISVGNIVGSNIFNTFAILGVTGLLKPLTISIQTIQIGIPFMIGATFLFIVTSLTKTISRFEGAIFLIIYATFVLQLVQTL